MLNVAIELRGRTPLLMHNVRLADPDDEVTRQISAITSKRKKTPEDRRDIARLEWFGGLYLDNGQIVVPATNIKKCIIEAAKVHKLGKAVGRALTPVDMNVSLAYEGSEDPQDLYDRSEFHFRTSVGVGANRTQRTRPQFPTWAVAMDALLLDDVLDISDLTRMVQLAGSVEGLGDGRVLGFGRFDGQVQVTSQNGNGAAS